MKLIPTLIIGAGPAGLATAGRMRQLGLKFDIIEASAKVGNAWRNHYDRLHLHTVNKWSHLPHLPFPEDFPQYVPRLALVDYMEQYAKHFDINPRFNVEVERINKKDLFWEVLCKDGASIHAQNIVVATGVNRVPYEPDFEGRALFQGKLIHSRTYRNPKPFLGQKVLVVGIGNTGAEVALDLSEHGIDTTIVSRGELSLVPRDLNGRPVQETAKTLEKLPFGLGDWLGSKIRRIYYGDLTKYGLKTSKISPALLLRAVY